MYNIIQRMVLRIPFHIRTRITDFLHPDTRCISYTFIEYPYSMVEIEALGLEESTLHIHSDIIHKLADEQKKHRREVYENSK